eukprot:11512765-Alexandrium_andersonii.AAC.1
MYRVEQPTCLPPSPVGHASTSSAAEPLGPRPAVHSLHVDLKAAWPATMPGGPMACVRRAASARIRAWPVASFCRPAAFSLGATRCP